MYPLPCFPLWIQKPMKKYFFLLAISFLIINLAFSQKSQRVIHTYVALCDNENQGIVPVPKTIGNGQDPARNLYWGAAFGIKTFIKKSSQWKLIRAETNTEAPILERLIFKHATEPVWMIADAWDGAFMKQTLEAYLSSLAGQTYDTVMIDGKIIPIEGGADLIAFIGHNGLMDVTLDAFPKANDSTSRDAIILSCVSRDYFEEPLRKANACGLVLTSGLMAPEAYTLEAALNGWIKNESSAEVRLKAAAAYHKYQKCGMKGAKWLFGAK